MIAKLELGITEVSIELRGKKNLFQIPLWIWIFKKDLVNSRFLFALIARELLFNAALVILFPSSYYTSSMKFLFILRLSSFIKLVLNKLQRHFQTLKKKWRERKREREGWKKRGMRERNLFLSINGEINRINLGKKIKFEIIMRMSSEGISLQKLILSCHKLKDLYEQVFLQRSDRKIHQ